MNIVQEKLLEIFENTVSKKDNLVYDGKVEEINHFNLLMKAGGEDALYKILGYNMCMLNCKYEGKKAVVVLFSIPVNPKTGNKLIADSVMEIIENVEDCFTTVDYLNSKEIRDEKFVYVTIVKKLEEDLDEREKNEVAQEACA